MQLYCRLSTKPFSARLKILLLLTCQGRSERVRGKSRPSQGFEPHTFQHAGSHYTILAHPCKYCRTLSDVPAIQCWWSTISEIHIRYTDVSGTGSSQIRQATTTYNVLAVCSECTTVTSHYKSNVWSAQLTGDCFVCCLKVPTCT